MATAHGWHRLGLMQVLLVGTYEQGRQPLEVARPAAVLRAGGHSVRVLDLAVEEADDGRSSGQRCDGTVG